MEQRPFDIKLAIESVQAIHKISGLGCTLYSPEKDGDGVVLYYSEGACRNMCPNCNLEGEDIWRPVCQAAHANAARFADSFGGRYFYLCGLDRIFIAAPIIADGVLAAALTVGPVHIFDRKEAHTGIDGLRPFPVREPAYVHYLSTLIAATAVSVSDSSQSHQRFIKRASLEQQAQINEFLAHNKGMVESEYPVALELTMTNAIKNADAITARVALNDILGYLLSVSQAEHSSSLKGRAYELITVMSRAALYAGVHSETLLEANSRASTRLEHMKSQDQICLLLQEHVDEMSYLVSRLKNVEYEGPIYLAVEYIQTNYNRRITLTSVAQKVGFSPAYLSRLFKEKLDCNFSTYLNQVRIQASKSALQATESSISEIAAMVGYDDPSYFSRVFKKVTGVSPGYYRSHRGYIDREREKGDLREH